MNNLAAKYSTELSSDVTQANLLRLRADFVTWAANRRMFETLCLFAQVKVIASTQIDALAQIQSGERIYLYLNGFLLDHYHENQELCFFVLMHELRHLTQAKSFRDWSLLVNFAPIWHALTETLDRNLLTKAGITNLDADSELKHDICNLAADAAMHEDLVHVFHPRILDSASKFMAQYDLAKNGEFDPSVAPVTVSYLEKIVGIPLERNQDWLYYAKHLVASLSERIRSEPELARLLVERQILSRIRSRYFDNCKLNDGALSAIDLLLGQAQGESKKIIEAQRLQNNVVAGDEGLDYEEIYQARHELNRAIKKIIETVQSVLKIGTRRKSRDTKTYAKPHRFLEEAPGLCRQIRDDPHCDSVLVLDTSGSMWIPELLDQMAAVTYLLKSRHLIMRAYCCDVNLHKLEVSSSGAVKFKGSGGTVWTREHHTQIINDLKTTKKINIYYCTDGEVNGLPGAQADERVNLIVVNIPAILDEELYRKARL